LPNLGRPWSFIERICTALGIITQAQPPCVVSVTWRQAAGVLCKLGALCLPITVAADRKQPQEAFRGVPMGTFIGVGGTAPSGPRRDPGLTRKPPLFVPHNSTFVPRPRLCCLESLPAMIGLAPLRAGQQVSHMSQAMCSYPFRPCDRAEFTRGNRFDVWSCLQKRFVEWVPIAASQAFSPFLVRCVMDTSTSPSSRLLRTERRRKLTHCHVSERRRSFISVADAR
jgi:hypothetical protein